MLKPEIELQKVFGKFILNSIKEGNRKAYNKLLERYKFLETLDNYVVCLDFNYKKPNTIMFFPNEKTMPTEVTEEIFVNYYVENLISFEPPLWITRVNNYYILTKDYVHKKTVRKLNSYELKELKELTDKSNEEYIAHLKWYYSRFKDKISKFSLV